MVDNVFQYDKQSWKSSIPETPMPVISVEARIVMPVLLLDTNVIYKFLDIIACFDIQN